MNSGKTIFSQLMDFLSPYEFHQCVARYNGNFNCASSPARSRSSTEAISTLLDCTIFTRLPVFSSREPRTTFTSSDCIRRP